jgi:hypothetical protein
MDNLFDVNSKLNYKCSYCEETGHNITQCKKDQHLIELLEKKPMPDFFKMPVKTCKRIASLTGIQTSLPKIRLATKFTKIWKEKNIEPIIVEDCAICMEKLQKTNVCTTSCGHMFCLECIFKVKEKSNKCPLCRKPLSKNQTIRVEQTQSPSLTIPNVISPPSSPFPDVNDVYLSGLLDNENTINNSSGIIINRSNIESLVNNIEFNNIIVNESITDEGVFIDSIINNITTPSENITITVSRNLESDFIDVLDSNF